MSIELYVHFIAKHLGVASSDVELERGAPADVVGLLWPFITPLRELPIAAYLATAPYNPAGETMFDAMLEALEADPSSKLSTCDEAVLSVWAERLRQSINVLGINEAGGGKVIVPPKSLPEHVRQVAAALMWLHQVEPPKASVVEF